MYDVIVVGTGTAGCTAAKTLSENGYKVLLTEKFKIPRYKSCLEQLIKKTVDLVQEYYGAAVPASVMCIPTENRGMIFTNDKGKEFRFEQPGLNVWRSSFDHWLAMKASEYGAWFNIKDNLLVLGVSVKDSGKTGGYYHRFIDYMKEHHNLQIDK